MQTAVSHKRSYLTNTHTSQVEPCILSKISLDSCLCALHIYFSFLRFFSWLGPYCLLCGPLNCCFNMALINSHLTDLSFTWECSLETMCSNSNHFKATTKWPINGASRDLRMFRIPRACVSGQTSQPPWSQRTPASGFARPSKEAAKSKRSTRVRIPDKAKDWCKFSSHVHYPTDAMQGCPFDKSAWQPFQSWAFHIGCLRSLPSGPTHPHSERASVSPFLTKAFSSAEFQLCINFFPPLYRRYGCLSCWKMDEYSKALCVDVWEKLCETEFARVIFGFEGLLTWHGLVTAHR